jgi:3-deoxy-D-manno-octulosonate 8-phosphate phosphatase (KDO 8-P phosphatase)
MKHVFKKDFFGIAKGVKILILDVDGVLTDGSIILDNKDNELKCFHVRDGHGIKMLLRQGIPVAFITGRYSEVVKRRARELGVKDVFQKYRDKTKAYNKLIKKYAVTDQEIAYIGDDIVDIPLLQKCGFSVAVADADDHVKAVAKMVTKNRGGRGAVREVCDLILKAKDLWKGIIGGYSQT